MNAKELRRTSGEFKPIKRNNIYFVLDNVLDTYNIGSAFRLADAVAAKGIFLCGKMEKPPNTKIKRASINTTECVPWKAFDSIEECLRPLKNIKNFIIALEVTDNAFVFKSKQYITVDWLNNPSYNVVVIVGNETDGVSSVALNMADRVVKLPMYGYNHSLNVSMALAILAYDIVTRPP